MDDPNSQYPCDHVSEQEQHAPASVDVDETFKMKRSFLSLPLMKKSDLPPFANKSTSTSHLRTFT